MKRLLLFLLASSFLSPLLAAKRPNIVLLFADDLGRYASAYADPHRPSPNDIVSTPTFDRIAREGALATNAFVSAPSCSPSRAAFITGLYPQRAGVPGNVSSQAGNHGMPAATQTVAELFNVNGYVTGHVGKWHLGYTPERMPNGQGFLNSFGHMGGCIDN